MPGTARLRSLDMLASALRTATTNSPDKRNTEHRGVRIVTELTGFTATGSITVTIQGKSPAPGSTVYYDIGSGAAITAAGSQVLTVYPGVTETANVDFSVPLPSIFRVRVVHANGVNLTYSVRAELLP